MQDKGSSKAHRRKRDTAEDDVTSPPPKRKLADKAFPELEQAAVLAKLTPPKSAKQDSREKQAANPRSPASPTLMEMFSRQDPARQQAHGAKSASAHRSSGGKAADDGDQGPAARDNLKPGFHQSSSKGQQSSPVRGDLVNHAARLLAQAASTSPDSVEN